jgi:hypothetical protein
MNHPPIRILLACCAATVPLHAPATGDPADPWRAFPLSGQIEGAVDQPTPVRLPLPRAWLQAGGAGQAQLRIRDDRGHEVAWAVATATAASIAPEQHPYQIHAYTRDGEGELVTLRAQHGNPVIHTLRVLTRTRDFRRAVAIEVADDGAAWRPLHQDVIIDASERLDFRRKDLVFAATPATWLRLRLGADMGDAAGNIDLRVGGMTLALRDLPQERAFQIDGFIGIGGQEQEIPAEWDDWIVPAPAATQQDGRSAYALDGVDLPLDRIEIATTQPFFVRPAALAQRLPGADNYHALPARGEFRRQAGDAEPVLHLAAAIAWAGDLRLTIDNGDNPPLPLDTIRLAWLRRSLVFVAEPGRSYTLLGGPPQTPAPRYDIARLVSTAPAEVGRLPVFQVTPPAPNPDWRPEPAGIFDEATRNFMFSGLVLLLAGAIGWWIWRIIRPGG